MSFSKISSVELNSRGATKLDNKPTISAQKLKEEFDAPAKEIVAPAVNRLVDELETDTAATNIGANVPNGLPTGTPKNIQSVLNALTTEVNNKENIPENIDVLDAISDVDGELSYNGNKMAKSSDLPTRTSELTNDSDYVSDADYVHTDNNYSDIDKILVLGAIQDGNYVHTDNNYTDDEKSKLSSLKNYELPVATINTLGGVKADGETTEVLSDGTLKVIGGGGGGSTVEWQQNVTEGTEIAEITIDGEKTKVYAPTGGGGGGSSDYTSLTSKPLINGETLIGNKTAKQLGLVPDTRTVNGKELSSNVTLDASDVGALPNSTEIYVKPSTGIPESDLADEVTNKLANLDENGQIDYENVKNAPTVPTKVSDLTNDSGYVTSSSLDEWLPEETLSGVGEQTVAFTVDTTKAYELWADTPNGGQVAIKESSLNGTTLTYVLDVPSNENGTKVRLRLVK